VRKRGDIALPGSPQLSIGGNFSLDACSHNRESWTTGFLEYKCSGVDGIDWGNAAIQHQLDRPQSGDFTLPVFTYPAGDKGRHLRDHVKGYVEQILGETS